MKRDDYLDDKDVAGFVRWAGNLVRGEWRLMHQWTTLERFGGRFRCSGLYEAYLRYSWEHRGFDGTMALFDDFRKRLKDACPIESYDDKQKFLTIAKEIAVDWGGSNSLNLWSSSNWGDMSPVKLQEHIDEIRQKLDPVNADTNDLPTALRMGAGFSKIYSALIPGFVIYDSRVACALACLVRLYRPGAKSDRVPQLLNLGIPEGRGNDGSRCTMPKIRSSQKAKHAKSNLQFAWLMQALVEDPGEFVVVPKDQRVDALQSALFMLGYSRLDDDAIVKSR